MPSSLPYASLLVLLPATIGQLTIEVSATDQPTHYMSWVRLPKYKHLVVTHIFSCASPKRSLMLLSEAPNNDH